MSEWKVLNDQDKRAVEIFKDYLRIPSVHPDVNYDDCVSFLRRQAHQAGLPLQVVETVLGKPCVVITWVGLEPNLPSVLLNSHMDVVPVYPDKWIHDPFSAYQDEDGNIYARGSQDMKSVGIQHLEAVRRLKDSGVRLQRTVHVMFVPDEETGGVDGMLALVTTDEFRRLNVGVALDEGIAHPQDVNIVLYGERTLWQIHVHCPGVAGHGSLITPDTAAEKVRLLLNRFLDYRQSQMDLLEADPSLGPGDVTSVNVTMLTGGVQTNVLPPELGFVVDMRLATSVDFEEFEDMLNRWCAEAGPGVYIEDLQKGVKEKVTSLENNPWWTAMSGALKTMKVNIKPYINPASADARFIRRVGIPAFGFSPMANTPVLLHGHNEFLNQDVFLKGIPIFCEVLKALGDVPP